MSEIILESLLIPLDQVSPFGFEATPRAQERFTLTLGLNWEKAATEGDLDASIDYGKLATELIFLGMNTPIHLVSELPEMILRYVLSYNEMPRGTRDRIAWVTISSPTLTLRKMMADATCFARETNTFGYVDIIYEHEDMGLYRLNVAPHATIPLHIHRTMQESEMTLSDHLRCQSQKLPYGLAMSWPKQLPHEYINTSDQVAAILCVDRPRFIPSDEVPSLPGPALQWLPQKRVRDIYQAVTGGRTP